MTQDPIYPGWLKAINHFLYDGEQGVFSLFRSCEHEMHLWKVFTYYFHFRQTAAFFDQINALPLAQRQLFLSSMRLTDSQHKSEGSFICLFSTWVIFLYCFAYIMQAKVLLSGKCPASENGTLLNRLTTSVVTSH